MSNLVSPYFDTELYNRVLLTSDQINNDIYLNLKNNLKRKIEKKCNKYGFITKIYKILDYKNGEIIAENFDSSVVFDIKYSCRICIPVIGSNIICKVDILNKSLIKASNGPIICIIGINNINNINFNINNNGEIIHSQTNKSLNVNDYIIVNIKGKNFFSNDERIIIISNLENIANNEMTKKFYKENLDIEELDDTSIDNETETETETKNIESENENYINL